MVKSYQLLNEFKQCNPRATLPESSGVAFLQQGNNNKSVQRTTEWKKKATCHNCGQKGHIRPKCPEPMTENDDDKKDDDNKPDKKSTNKIVYSTTAEADLKDDEIKMIETTAQEIYLACAFVVNSDLR